ncbi:MAG: glycosyltransferase [Pirellulaceae bacterium]
MSRQSASETGTIAYVGPFSFPIGGPGARRILGNALALRDAGYRVVVGTGQMSAPDTPREYLGIEVVSLSERTAETLPVSLKHAAYVFMGRKTQRWLAGLNPRPAAVILYSGFTPYFARLIPWCRRSGVPLVFDATEWYGPSRNPGGRFGMYRWSFELAMRHYCVRSGNVIAISRYLEDYYRERGCTTIRVPPTLDTACLGTLMERNTGARLRLGYAGSPGTKDLLDDVLEAVTRTNIGGTRVEFHVAGMSEEDLLKYPTFRRRGISSLPECIVSLGRLTHMDALKAVAGCNFTVLMRPPQIDSVAGFPTKVVESMSVGTPVICNLTSDLGEHVFHGRTGLVCPEPTADACAVMLREALAFSREQLAAMRHHTSEHAKMRFDYRCYVSAFSTFIRELKVM